MRFVIYPNLCHRTGEPVNLYIKDFITALENNGGHEVCNKPHKNPLLSIVFPIPKADAYIFHWIEDVPAYKHGYIQLGLACLMVLLLKLRKRKIVWFLHDKKPHAVKRAGWKFIMWLMATFSDLIVTHAQEGKKIASELNKASTRKVVYICHPTKNRMSLCHPEEKKEYDFLIWGTLSVYKGVYEFLKFMKEKDCSYRIKIIGSCPSEAYWESLVKLGYKYADLENRSVSYEELADLVSVSKFVLVPYQKDTVLSSAMLMDSLSLGAVVIGPETGSFLDLSKEKDINVFTFSSFYDIDRMMAEKGECHFSIEGYPKFLEENNWSCFVRKFISEVNRISD